MTSRLKRAKMTFEPAHTPFSPVSVSLVASYLHAPEMMTLISTSKTMQAFSSDLVAKRLCGILPQPFTLKKFKMFEKWLFKCTGKFSLKGIPKSLKTRAFTQELLENVQRYFHFTSWRVLGLSDDDLADEATATIGLLKNCRSFMSSPVRSFSFTLLKLFKESCVDADIFKRFPQLAQDKAVVKAVVKIIPSMFAEAHCDLKSNRTFVEQLLLGSEKAPSREAVGILQASAFWHDRAMLSVLLKHDYTQIAHVPGYLRTAGVAQETLDYMPLKKMFCTKNTFTQLGFAEDIILSDDFLIAFYTHYPKMYALAHPIPESHLPPVDVLSEEIRAGKRNGLWPSLCDNLKFNHDIIRAVVAANAGYINPHRLPIALYGDRDLRLQMLKNAPFHQARMQWNSAMLSIWRINRDFVEVAVDKGLFRFIPNNFKEDKTLMKKSIDADWRTVKCFKPDFRDDDDIADYALRKNVLSLQYLSERIQLKMQNKMLN